MGLFFATTGLLATTPAAQRRCMIWRFTMWIKTQGNDLLNTDVGLTYCSFGIRPSSYPISEGNAIPAIINSLRRGDNYLGVNP